ncbi:hypothetical protein HK098_001365 [Nowakowskiella sp. JEL0407]|nr:hypothetical protein HK098_001365 [Nowakowskiella sp. JEL0407]
MPSDTKSKEGANSHFAYTKSVETVLADLKVKADSGLSESEAKGRLEKYGLNELPEDPPTPLWKLILDQFQDQLVIILLIAAAISFVLAIFETDEHEKQTAFVEPFVILVILFTNAVVGVVQESNAEKAIEALKEYSPDESKVVRNGTVKKIEAHFLVPGDIIHLAVGDKVPADCRILEIFSSSFKVDQAILTGEAVSVSKEPETIIKDKRAVKQDQINMLFSGTSITVGKASAVVVATGTSTAIGDIHESITSQISEKTPLKIALDDFGDQLAKIISVICLLVWIINIRHFTDPTFGGNWLKGAIYYFKIAVALAVAAIPEGLAVVITTCLALGTKKMAKRGAIVRRLASVETLGSTGVICSDKTGTLTTNQMSVRRVMVLDSKSEVLEWQLTGSTYGPEGVVSFNQKEVDRNVLGVNSTLNELMHVASLCNDSKLVYDQKSDTFQKIGEPTEAALKSMVEKFGTDDPILNKSLPVLPHASSLAKLSPEEKMWRDSQANDYVASKYTVLATLEFSRDRKSMGVHVQNKKTGKLHLMVKGAPEQVLERCEFIRLNNSSGKIPLTKDLKNRIAKKLEDWAEKEALRVLAFAVVDDPKMPAKIDPSDYIKYESKMTFLGLAGMMDPPRAEVQESIRKCRLAGIRVIVITGDNKKTAESICRQIGIFSPKEDLKGKSFTGREFDDMSLAEKKKAVAKAGLFSRTEPTHKQELVDLLRAEGFVVAMTGDGVNDAPALKKADIGIAMGTGTDVAKLASDMVLADDNFATIVTAVEEGRSIYSNTKQFIRYLISSNIGEVVSIFLTVVLGMPEALIPVQLLWVNLVTDGLPATALGFNPSDNDIMRRPPRSSKEPIVTTWLFIRYLVIGTYVGIATVGGYAWWFVAYSGGPQITFEKLTKFHQCASLFPELGCEMFTNEMASKATTMSLSILVVVEMFNAMNSLSENESLLTFPLWKNIYLVLAVCLSMILHFLILYVPVLADIFSIQPLNSEEWIWVVVWSAPVLVIDEILKFISRNFVLSKTAKQKSD